MACLLNVGYVSCRQYREFGELLDAYVDAVSRGTIKPSPGRSVIDHLLNNDRQSVTVFVPSDSIETRITAYEQERYVAVKRGVEPPLLQKVMTDVNGVLPPPLQYTTYEP